MVNGNGLLIRILAGVISLGIILILGSYGYTRSEIQAEQDEKKEWRKEHQQVLDKRFNELKQGQDKLTDTINRTTDDTKDILKQILEEQRKVRQDNNVKRRER